MSYSDEDDDLPQISEEKKLTQADHGKRDALRKAIQEQEGKHVHIQETELKTDVNLKQLKDAVAGEADEETKRMREQQEEEASTIGTKTRKEMEEEQVQTAHDKDTPKKQIEKVKKKQDVQDQTEEEYQQQMG